MKKTGKLSMPLKIFLGMLLGGIVGVLFQQQVSFLSVIGDIFLRLIQMSIVLLVMGQVVQAVGELDPQSFRGIGARTVIIFFGSSFAAAFFGIAVGSIFQPGKGVDITAFSKNFNIEEAKMGSISEIIVDFFPTNIMKALSEGTIIQVIVFSLLFGLALSLYTKETNSRKIIDLVKEANGVLLKMITLIMQVAPLAIFALIASTVAELGAEVILPMLKYLVIYGLSTLAFLIVWLIVVQGYTGLSCIKVAKKMLPMSIMALATTSSAITLPVAVEDSEKRLGIKESVSKLVLPLGVSLNSNGSAMHMAITIITIAQMVGVHYELTEMLYIALLATLASLANAVVPGAGLVSLSIVIPQMGLPLESIALFAGVEWFVGMLRTILNVDSDVFSAILVAHKYDAIDRQQYVD